LNFVGGHVHSTRPVKLVQRADALIIALIYCLVQLDAALVNYTIALGRLFLSHATPLFGIRRIGQSVKLFILVHAFGIFD